MTSTSMRRVAAAAAMMLSAGAAVITSSCGSDTFASAGPDASDDATGDVGTADSSVADASSGDAGKPRFCDTVSDASFCADFDRPNGDLLEGWTAFDTAAAGTITGDQEDFISPPQSAELGVGLVVAANTYGRLIKTFPTSATDVTLDFDVNLGDVPADAVLVPFVIRFGSPKDDLFGVEVGLRFNAGVLETFYNVANVQDGAPPTYTGVGFTYADGGIDGWAHLRIHALLDFDAGATTTFTVGSGPTKQMNLLFASQGLFAPPMSILVGVAKATLLQAGNLTVHVDNVVFKAF